MLSHTGGLPFKSALEEPTLDLFPLAARVRSHAMTPLEFGPGSKYQYSNAGINTAARIIEVLTGMSFERFLDERLFQPLGMKDTTFWDGGMMPARPDDPEEGRRMGDSDGAEANAYVRRQYRQGWTL